MINNNKIFCVLGNVRRRQGRQRRQRDMLMLLNIAIYAAAAALTYVDRVLFAEDERPVLCYVCAVCAHRILSVPEWV